MNGTSVRLNEKNKPIIQPVSGPIQSRKHIYINKNYNGIFSRSFKVLSLGCRSINKECLYSLSKDINKLQCIKYRKVHFFSVSAQNYLKQREWVP